MPKRLGYLKLLNPVDFYYLIIDGNGMEYIFETKTAFNVWLSASFPYAVLMALAIVTLLVIAGFFFTKEDA
jgi:hypothetical protein